MFGVATGAWRGVSCGWRSHVTSSVTRRAAPAASPAGETATSPENARMVTAEEAAAAEEGEEAGAGAGNIDASVQCLLFNVFEVECNFS